MRRIGSSTTAPFLRRLRTPLGSVCTCPRAVGQRAHPVVTGSLCAHACARSPRNPAESHAILAVQVIRRSWQSPLIVLLVREAVTSSSTAGAGAGGVDENFGSFSFGSTAAAPAGDAMTSGFYSSNLARGSDSGAANASANETGAAVKTITSYGLHVFGFGCPRDASLQVLCRHQSFVQLDYRELQLLRPP